MQYKIKGMPFNVVAVEALTTHDADHVGWVDFNKGEIQLLRTLSLAAAFRTLAHEVAHAWLGHENPPETEEQFCVITAPMLVTWYEETQRLGGVAALAEVMGLPCEGEIAKSANPHFAEEAKTNPDFGVVRWVICAELTDELFIIFRQRCESMNLNPLQNDVFPRISWDPRAKVRRVELGLTIRAMRKIARRSGQLDFITAPEWAGDELVWLEGWPRATPPVFARVGVKRLDSTEPFWGVARYDSFVQMITVGDREVPSPFWSKMPDHMLAKCAENLALAKAFTECDGLFIGEMMRSETEFTAETKRQAKRAQDPFAPAMVDAQLQQLRARQAESAGDVAIDEDRSPAIDREAGPASGLHRMMADSGVHMESLRTAIIDQVKAKWSTLEDENPELFAHKVMEEVYRRKGRR